jgi:serine/threonine protein kinase
MAVIFFGELGAFIIVVVSCIVCHRGLCCKRTERDEEQTILQFMDPLDSRPPTVENFLNYYSSQVPTRYSYAQIRTYTNNLAEQLGKGGFGTVYKGKHPSGRLIAVKILDESKQSEQQFIAEVGTVGNTYHVNLVRMLGYCFEGSKRALVYEYMVNGSLEKYIHGNHQEQLNWKQLYSIAIGTARGISYLHDECRNRILHCDIKPHNILLDVNFLPKVADFGLAKISKREESHISAAHGGTLGYAAPEMWSRLYGPVTDRCDVYSYGMLIMEMVGGRKNIDLETRSSKIFYAEWAFKQVEKGEFGNLRTGHISEEDHSLIKKLSLVGLWCIQFHASRRPRMSKVIQMLEGEVEITTPPFPFPVDTPPIGQLSSSDQSSLSEQCFSSYALEVQMRDPNITVDTPSLLQLSSLDQSSSSNQCSSSYASEVLMTDPKST